MRACRPCPISLVAFHRRALYLCFARDLTYPVGRVPRWGHFFLSHLLCHVQQSSVQEIVFVCCVQVIDLYLEVRDTRIRRFSFCFQRYLFWLPPFRMYEFSIVFALLSFLVGPRPCRLTPSALCSSCSIICCMIRRFYAFTCRLLRLSCASLCGIAPGGRRASRNDRRDGRRERRCGGVGAGSQHPRGSGRGKKWSKRATTASWVLSSSFCFHAQT